MERFESEQVLISSGQNQVYEYLLIPENYRFLMPDKVRDFRTSDDTATLDIEGIGEVILKITETETPSKIVMKPQNKLPFEFSIEWSIKALNDEKSQVQAFIHAKLNFMMKLMAEKLLKNLLNTQVSKLKEQLEK